MPHPSRNDTVHTLMHAAPVCDPRVRNCLIGGHVDRVKALVRRKVPREDVDDVVQEVILTEITVLSRFRGVGSFGGWAATIVKRAIWKYHQQRTPAVLVDLDEVTEVAGSTNGGLEELDAVEHQMTLDEVLDGLPPRQRAVVVLHLREGLSFAEVGDRIGTSEGAARVLFHRARSKIRATDV